jgi:hypothetical protein
MTLRTILSAILLVGLVYCGSNNSDPTGPAAGDTGGTRAQQVKKARITKTTARKTAAAAKKRSAQTAILSAQFSPEVGGAGTQFKVNANTSEPLKENQNLSYSYWINGQKTGDSTDNIFPPNTYKRGDVVFADVSLMEDDELIDKKRTEMMQIQNAPPVIKDVILPNVKGPGVYKAAIKAEDADNDPLTYSLETDLHDILQIDPSTGVVTCNLDPKVPETLSFIVVATDDGGARAKKQVTMKFFKQPVKEE